MSLTTDDPAAAEVRLATAAELPAVARLFGEAFVEDPMLRWPYPSDASAADFADLFAILLEAYRPLNVTWVPDDLSGGTVALPPAEAGRFLAIEGPTRDLIRPLTDDAGARYDMFWDWLGDHVPDEPCWFLDIVAVDARARGRGVGRRLIRNTLIPAHTEGLPVFLETANPANLPIYEHLGFRLVERADAPGGGPTIWFMRADPPG